MKRATIMNKIITLVTLSLLVPIDLLAQSDQNEIMTQQWEEVQQYLSHQDRLEQPALLMTENSEILEPWQRDEKYFEDPDHKFYSFIDYVDDREIANIWREHSAMSFLQFLQMIVVLDDQEIDEISVPETECRRSARDVCQWLREQLPMLYLEPAYKPNGSLICIWKYLDDQLSKEDSPNEGKKAFWDELKKLHEHIVALFRLRKKSRGSIQEYSRNPSIYRKEQQRLYVILNDFLHHATNTHLFVKNEILKLKTTQAFQLWLLNRFDLINLTPEEKQIYYHELSKIPPCALRRMASPRIWWVVKGGVPRVKHHFIRIPRCLKKEIDLQRIDELIEEFSREMGQYDKP